MFRLSKTLLLVYFASACGIKGEQDPSQPSQPSEADPVPKVYLDGKHVDMNFEKLKTELLAAGTSIMRSHQIACYEACEPYTLNQLPGIRKTIGDGIYFYQTKPQCIEGNCIADEELTVSGWEQFLTDYLEALKRASVDVLKSGTQEIDINKFLAHSLSG